MKTLKPHGELSDPLLSLEEVGRMLGGRSVKTVRRYMQRRILPMGRIVGRSIMLRLSEVENAIQQMPKQA